MSARPDCGSCRYFDKAAWPENPRFGKCTFPVPKLPVWMKGAASNNVADYYVDCKVWEFAPQHETSAGRRSLRQAQYGHFWTVEECVDSNWSRSAVGHAWALEADASSQCEELRRRYGNRIFRVKEYGAEPL